MPPISVLIKPASSACNMNCSYCFYRDVSSHREHVFEGMLSIDAMETIMISAMEFAEESCTFAFQGGEPTLAGLDFFREVVALGKQYGKPGVQISYALQTNGYCIDEEWAEFFQENRFLIGLSLDGPSEIHDANRRDHLGKGTCRRVLQAARVLDQYHVSYNILCVVTGRNARSVHKIYNFYKKNNFRYLQFIPCLEPLNQPQGQESYALSGVAYGKFLVTLFDLWYQDLQKGTYISIRHFDNWLSILLGRQPELCSLQGHCSIQFVIEGDGSVYPCDFYVLDEWKLGTIGQQSFQEMGKSDTARRFVQTSLAVPDMCRSCSLYAFCRNGCRRERLKMPDGSAARNLHCEAYRYFFENRGNEIYMAAQMLRRFG